MLVPGPAKKVTIHVNEDTSSGTDFLYKEVLALLLDRGVAGAKEPVSRARSRARVGEARGPAR